MGVHGRTIDVHLATQSLSALLTLRWLAMKLSILALAEGPCFDDPVATAGGLFSQLTSHASSAHGELKLFSLTAPPQWDALLAHEISNVYGRASAGLASGAASGLPAKKCEEHNSI